MQSPVGQNALPADTAQIDLYHVDAGFFLGRIFSQIILCALSEILPLFEIASVTGPTVS